MIIKHEINIMEWIKLVETAKALPCLLNEEPKVHFEIFMRIGVRVTAENSKDLLELIRETIKQENEIILPEPATSASPEAVYKHQGS